MESDDAATESSYMSEVYGTEEEEEENNAMPVSDEMEYEHLEQRELDYEQKQQRFMQELQLHAKTWQLLGEETLGPSDL
eukprot:gene10183-10343_t